MVSGPRWRKGITFRETSSIHANSAKFGSWETLLDRVSGLEQLLGSRADPEVFGEIDPAHGSVRIDQEFGGPGDGLLAAPLGVKQIVLTDDLGLRVRQESEGVCLLAAVVAGNLRGIDAYGDGADAARREIVQMLFDAP